MGEASAARWETVEVALPPPGGMSACEARGVRLVLCNVGGAPYVLEDRCPHAFATLSDGRLEGAVLECPLHGGKLDVRDGRPVAAPIRKPARTFAVRQSGARLEVEIAHA